MQKRQSRPFYRSSLLDEEQIMKPNMKVNPIMQNTVSLTPMLNVWKNPLTQPATLVSLNMSNNAFDTNSLRSLWNMTIRSVSCLQHTLSFAISNVKIFSANRKIVLR